MSNSTYNTDHGNFLIKKENVPRLIELLKKLALEEHGPGWDDAQGHDPEYAFGRFDLGCFVDNDGNVEHLFLDDSRYNAEKIEVFEHIAPVVEPDSFIVFVFGESSGCFAASWYRDAEGVTRFREESVYTVTKTDMQEIAKALKTAAPELHARCVKKYGVPERGS